MQKYKTFQTNRLYLHPMQVEHASFLLELLNSPKWIKYIGDRNVKTLEAASDYIKEKMLPQLETHGYGNYAVIRKSDHVVIGSCGLYDRDGLDGVDIGFAFLPQYEGNGYAYEAASKILSEGITTFGIKLISAITTKENISSQKLIKKLGLTYIEDIQLPDDDEVLLLYRLTN